MNADLLEQYAQGGELLRQAIAGMTPHEILESPVPGKWSTHQVIIHLADGETAFADRIKRIIAMDNPLLLAWDEKQFAANLFYNEQSSEDAAALIEISRRQITRVLCKLPPEAFARTGKHSERGNQTLKEVIGFAIWHLNHHLKFVAEKRKALGK